MIDQFTADIAAMLEVALIGSGLIAANLFKKKADNIAQAGAYVLLIGGVIGLTCTSYWWVKYWKAGYFDNPMVKTVNLFHHDGDLLHHFPPDQE